MLREILQDMVRLNANLEVFTDECVVVSVILGLFFVLGGGE